MKQEEKEQINETYNDYVESVTPKANLWLRMAKAFLVGGLICLLGQCIINIGKKYGLDDQTAASYCSLTRHGDLPGHCQFWRCGSIGTHHGLCQQCSGYRPWF